MSASQHSPLHDQGTNPAFPAATILGYPRIGPNRELKRAVESFWAGRTTAAELEVSAQVLRARTREHLVGLGLTEPAAVPSSFSFYDQVLDVIAAVGAVPERFAHLQAADGSLDLAGYFTLARGEGTLPPLEMTKWFDSNYHYLVPEIGPGTDFRLVGDRVVAEFVEARDAGVVTRPALVGPVTFLLLSKPSDDAPDDFRPLDRLADLLPVYAELLGRLAEAGAPWVQLDEPALVTDALDVAAERIRAAVTTAYRALATDLAVGSERPAILLAAPYGDLGDNLPDVAASDVEAVALDLVKGRRLNAPAADSVTSSTTASVATDGIALAGTDSPEGSRDPAGARDLRAGADVVAGLARKTLVAGVVDGHNIWRTDLDARLAQAEALAAVGARVTIGTSTSLFHVPHTTEVEDHLDAGLRSWLAFADQKVAEVVALARGLVEGRDAIAEELAAASAALADRASAAGVRVEAVRARTAALTASDVVRGDVAGRRAAQDARLALPPLPTTTIGSFPQTTDIRVARAAHARGELSDAGYEAAMEAEIARVIELQEQIGLDVLVHGEAERNDMVQYFAELLDGFAVTRHGWVQSYGSRCTRPSILWGDVSRPAPMTVRWTTFAQSLTPKPVKGMLTGPVTIMAWSFVRDDVPLAETANQIGFALRDELADLEAAGVAVIQVDEPALRELLPLRRAEQAAYLEWSVGSFRLATAGVRADTQVHTHLCYSEFGEVIGAIDALDADVTSIEAARSRMEILGELRASGFGRGVGPGVYDIHSPRVPSTDELSELIGLAVADVDPGLLWINPDCGLKTRGYAEVTPALTNLVEAARAARTALVLA